MVAVIRHKGTHYAGHYECFRRKNLAWWKSHLPMYQHYPMAPNGANGSSDGARPNGSTPQSPVAAPHRQATSKPGDNSAGTEPSNPASPISPISSSSSPTKANKQESNNTLASTLRLRRSRSQSNGKSNGSATVSPTRPADEYIDEKEQEEQVNVPLAQAQQASVKSQTSSWSFGFGFPSLSAFSSDNASMSSGSSNGDSASPTVSHGVSNGSSNRGGQHPRSLGRSQTQPVSSSSSTLDEAMNSEGEGASNSNVNGSSKVQQQQQSQSQSQELPFEILPPSISHDWWQISDESSYEKSMKDVLKEESGRTCYFMSALQNRNSQNSRIFVYYGWF